MTEIIRHCPDCDRGRIFAQHHGPAGRCPDTADQCCPEWYCVVCGATLLIGDLPPAPPVHADTVHADTVHADTVPPGAALTGVRHRVA